jgi:hypothetical protein
MEVRQPVFIVGAGRSGSTVVQTLMSRHPHLAWLTLAGKRFPGKPEWHRRMLNAVDSAVIGSSVARHAAPSEIFDYWDHYAKGFRRSCRNLLPQDVTVQTKKKIRAALAELLTERRQRLVLKATGWSRMGYIKEIFPDAKFIHVLRDGRAVANSFMSVDWWLGWQGPQNWRYGELSAEHAAEWERHDRSFVALAAIQWKIIIRSVEEGRQHVDDSNFYELRYERLCEDPIGTMKEVTRFADLSWTPEFERSVGAERLRSMNDRWRTELTSDQQRILQDVLKGMLDRYGYPAVPLEPVAAGAPR